MLISYPTPLPTDAWNSRSLSFNLLRFFIFFFFLCSFNLFLFLKHTFTLQDNTRFHLMTPFLKCHQFLFEILTLYFLIKKTGIHWNPFCPDSRKISKAWTLTFLINKVWTLILFQISLTYHQIRVSSHSFQIQYCTWHNSFFLSSNISQYVKISVRFDFWAACSEALNGWGPESKPLLGSPGGRALGSS